ncbi:MAG: hypothetical protein K2H23_00915 [Oscillospiraceae bacterium]|nr:hypothetical protein [Oscillospiraceae bacterium]
MEENYNAYNEVQTEENYNVYNEIQTETTEKQIHTPSLVLMIIGAVFALLFTYVTYVCSTISLVMSIKRRHTHKTGYAIVINIIALAAALVNSILGVIIYFNTMGMM